MANVNQKEYLKKYLSIGKLPGQKKKKRKVKNPISVKIIDDDLTTDVTEDAWDAFQGEIEDAPQIVAVIDERPPSMGVDVWKPVGENASTHITKNTSQYKARDFEKIDRVNSKLDKDLSPPRPQKNKRIRKYEELENIRAETLSRKDLSSSQYTIPESVSEKQYDSDGDISPPRRENNSKTSSDLDLSPPRKQLCKIQKVRDIQKNDQENTERNRVSKATIEKNTVTLDGKKAGLQNAKDLVQETIRIRKNENDFFNNMSAEISGKGAATVVRGQHLKNQKPDLEEAKKSEENKKKYSRWGRGLKQVEDHNEKVAEEIYEMSKPLARYADDEDLEKYLKEQEREGDPMLAYIRSKKKKDAVSSGKVLKPQYEGEFMPNRFGIRPGVRWDGVDRSNGYEQKWFKAQNSKQAEQEEVYKWSTSDM